MHDRRDREKEKRRKGSEWELERSQRHGVMECVGMVRGRGGGKADLKADEQRLWVWVEHIDAPTQAQFVKELHVGAEHVVYVRQQRRLIGSHHAELGTYERR